MNSPLPVFTDAEILADRPAKHAVDSSRPYAFFVEPECTASGRVEDMATIFLTNRECPYRCLMCDLWKNTTDATVPLGAIPEQIDFALEQLPPARHIKLYNSGNFFDRKAIPPADHAAIAERVRKFETVIVENHPRLCSEECVRFRDRLGTTLEIAMGLETVHPQVLPALNKQMTLDDFDRAARFLVSEGIAMRAFILLRPPFLNEAEGIVWAVRSIEHAFSVGVGCCAVIPTRGGNGAIDRLQRHRQFSPPRLTSLEEVLEVGIRLRGGRVFADLWDAEQFAHCSRCCGQRIERLRRMNLRQEIEPPVVCDCRT